MGSPCSIIPQIRNPNRELVDSKLFTDMLKRTLNREKTKQFYEYVHSDEFMAKFGDWINYKQPNTDENGEPLIDSVLEKYVVDDGIADKEVYYAPNDEEILNENQNQNSYRFQEVIDQKKKMLGQLSSAYDYAQRNEMFLKAEQIGRRIGLIRNEIDVLNNKNKRPTAIEDIKDFATRDYRTLQQMFRKETVAKEELQFAKEMIHLWSNMQSTMLTQDELDSQEVMKTVNKIENQFNNFHNDKIRPAYRTNLEAEAEQKAGKGILEGIFDDKTNRLAVKDIDWATSEGRNISKTGRLIGDALAIIKQDSHQRARDEYNREVEKLQKLHEEKEAYKKETGLTDADIFNQVDAQGNETSNNVYRFTQQWFDQKAAAKKKGAKAHATFVRDNAETMDPRMLIEDNQVDGESVPDKYLYKSAYTQDMIDAKEKALKDLLGEKAYNDFLADQKKKLENYKKRREAKYVSLNQLEGLSEYDVDVEMNDWVKKNSPYAAMEARDRPSSAKDSQGNYVKRYGEAGIYDIPVRTKKGEDSGYYDKKFERIENDSRLLNYYDFFTETVDKYKQYLTPSQRRGMRINSLPYVERTYLEKMREDGMAAAASDYWSMYQDGIKAGKSFKASESERQLPTPIEDKDRMIKQIIDNKINQKRSEGGDITNEDRRQFRKEAEQEISNMQQNERTDVLSAYLASLVSFKYAARIQTTMDIANNVVEDGMEIKAEGGVKIGDFNQDPEMTEGGLDRLKKSMKFFVNNFYGISDTPWGVKETGMKYNPETGNVEKKDAKIYNRKEKQELKKLEEQKEKLNEQLQTVEEQMKSGEINAGEGAKKKANYEKSIKDVEEKMDKLGDHFAASGVAQNVQQYLQIKTMGYNFFSAFATLGFGVINNYTEAGDGRSFNEKELTEAYSMVMNSVLKNSTLNAVETETAKKIRNMMDTYNFSATETTQVGQDGADISRQRDTGWKGLLKRFLPYKSQQHAEYLAQAPIMIARMKRIKVNDAEGNERTLWDAHDSNGDWNTELMGENTYYAGDPDNPEHNMGRAAVKTNIDELIEKNHGDYSGELPTKFTEDVFKQGVMQFRKWIVESYASRWQARKMQKRLGYEVKGRFRTGAFGLAWSSDNSSSLIEQNVFAIKQLLRKVTFQGTRYDEMFDEVDAANLRANLNELVMALAITGVGILLSGMGDDDDENSGVLNYMLNWLHRVESDILMYVDPRRTVDILKNPVAGFSILEDVTAFGEATVDLMAGEDEIEGGQYDGDSKFLRESLGFVPLFTEVPKLEDLSRLQRQAQ